MDILRSAADEGGQEIGSAESKGRIRSWKLPN